MAVVWRLLLVAACLLAGGTAPAWAAAGAGPSEAIFVLQILLLVVVGRTLNAGTDGWAFAIIKAETDEAARQIMNDDPFVLEGVVTPEIVQFELLVLEPKNA